MKFFIALTLSLAAVSAQAQTLTAGGLAGQPSLTRLENKINAQSASFAASLANIATEIDGLKARIFRLENTAQQLQRNYSAATIQAGQSGATVEATTGPDTNTQLVPVSCQGSKTCVANCPSGFRRISQTCRGSGARFLPSNTGGICDGPETVSLTLMCGN